jgi:hypothetical protein
METTTGRHFLTPQHFTELGRPKPLPLDKQEHFAVCFAEHAQGLMDCAFLGRHRINLEGALL